MARCAQSKTWHPMHFCSDPIELGQSVVFVTLLPVFSVRKDDYFNYAALFFIYILVLFFNFFFFILERERKEIERGKKT